MQAFVEARYEYHWTPLLGCLVGQLAHIGAAQPSYVIGAVSGLSYQPPQAAALPPLLSDGLSALGVAAQISERQAPNRFQRIRARRRIRRELRADRPVTAYGLGVSAFGPDWGLIVGCDDERRAWRRDGPMTEQVSPWLPEAEFDRLPVWILIMAQRAGRADAEQIRAAAARALTASLERARRDLRERIAVLDSSLELDAQRHAYEVQTLAANWGEAARFWREQERGGPAAVQVAAVQQAALLLSRYATLFPYPMGGQPNHPGVRSAAIHILREAADALDAAH